MKKILLLLLLMFPASHAAQAETVCMVGGSVVVGIGDRGKFWRTKILSYRPDIVYVGRYYDGTYWHDGISGNTTADVLARLDSVTGCTKAILHVGGNDIIAGVQGSVVASNIALIADRLAARGVTVRIDTILPLNSTASGADYFNSVILWTNNRTAELVAGRHMVIDTWYAFYLLGGGTPDGAGLYYDAVHPSYTGYWVLAKYMGAKI